VKWHVWDVDEEGNACEVLEGVGSKFLMSPILPSPPICIVQLYHHDAMDIVSSISILDVITVLVNSISCCLKLFYDVSKMSI
jgi:hypothetical protein